MKAVRVHEYHSDPQIDDIPEPTLQGPLDVIVKIGGAGVCRTDLHIVNGDWQQAMNPDLPYVIGHENAGWVHEIGDAVTNVKVGDCLAEIPDGERVLTVTTISCDEPHAGEVLYRLRTPGGTPRTGPAGEPDGRTPDPAGLDG